MTPTKVLKDEEFLRCLEDLKHLISLVRISSIEADPAAFVRFHKKMNEMQDLMVKKLVQREINHATKDTADERPPLREVQGLRGELRQEPQSGG